MKKYGILILGKNRVLWAVIGKNEGYLKDT